MGAMKTRFAAFAAAAAVAMTPAVANADIVDDALAAIPAGQISCEQAEAYWTSESEYNAIRSQAQAVAPFHPRGGEITDALNRVEEAANRCGLKGGGAQAPANNNTGNNNPAPSNNQGNNNSAPANNNTGNNNPAPAPATQPAPPADAINIGVAPGTPYVSVPAGPETIVIPDVLTIIEQTVAQIAPQFNIPQLPQFQLPQVGSSF